MPTIFVKDDLRASVEAASGGKITVLYTATGQPSYMYVFPKFRIEDIDPAMGSGVHPAFNVGGVEKSEIFIGAYPGIVKNGELLSLPGADPSIYLSQNSFVNAARANGAGWHIMSNIEFASVALWCWKNGFLPRGNTNYGRSNDAAWETARRVDGGMPGNTTGTARTLTGSGPAGWRHDNTPAGIADMVGNVWEWTPGMRIVGGELQVIPNNNAALDAADLGPTSSAWKAIDGVNGNFITPTFTGSIANNDYAPTTSRSVRIAESGTEPYTLVRVSGASLEGMMNPGSTPVASSALAILKQYGLYPVANSGLGGDGIWYKKTGEQMALRGGDWVNAANSGVFALLLIHERVSATASIGGRPAFVI